MLVPQDQAGKTTEALRGMRSRLAVGEDYHHLGFHLSSGRISELHAKPLGPRTSWRASDEEIWGSLAMRTDAGVQ